MKTGKTANRYALCLKKSKTGERYLVRIWLKKNGRWLKM